jgi:ComF family protein
MRPIDGLLCSICGERLVSRFTISPLDGAARCGLCQRLEAPFLRAAAYGSYEGGLRELIQLLKYEQVRPAATVLGRMLAETITSLPPGSGMHTPVVVPVPLHSSKLRQRGFNQSELIARAAIKLLAESGRKFELKPFALERVRATESQTGLTRHQRRENVRGAFRVVSPREIQSREVLLVDDVFTTGTTVSECARILRRAGAARIWVVTVARVLRPEPTFATATPSADRASQSPQAMAARA